LDGCELRLGLGGGERGGREGRSRRNRSLTEMPVDVDVDGD
jgi:hypothetical protein